MKGKAIRLSPGRQLICDLMHASASVPTVPVQRRMHLAEVIAARAAHPQRPSWASIFAKAYAKVAAAMPELRRSYVKLPWHHLYEYPVSVASLAVEREVDDEKVVLIARIKDPARYDLVTLNQLIKDYREKPVQECKEFRRALGVSRLPRPLRRFLWWLGLNMGRQRANYFGTFGLSAYSALGAESLHPRSLCTTTLTYGVMAADGSLDVRIIYDHRALDGANVARALALLEDVLTGDIVTELGGAERIAAA